MPEERIAGTVRLSPDIRAQVDAFADARGIDYNAAMNILVRAGLAAEAPPRRSRTAARPGK